MHLSAGRSVGKKPNHSDLIAFLSLTRLCLGSQPGSYQTFLSLPLFSLSLCVYTWVLALTIAFFLALNLPHVSVLPFASVLALSLLCFVARGLTPGFYSAASANRTQWQGREGEKTDKARTLYSSCLSASKVSPAVAPSVRSVFQALPGKLLVVSSWSRWPTSYFW